MSLSHSYIRIICFIFLANISFGQNFLNGSFEINTAGGVDQINLANATFNGFMSNVNSYGTTPNLDIIQSPTWGGGGAQHCKWYVALTGSATDAFNMTLSAPLVTGNTYTISFYDRKDGAWPGFPIQIGVSTNNSSIGTIVYTAPVGATTNVWTQRTFTFVAPNNGQYISVIQNAGTTQTWVHVDNFVMNNVITSGNLNIAASATTICVGSSAVFTVTGASTYTWNPSATLSSANASVVTATPPVTTTYSVTGLAGGCVYTGSITLNVIAPPAVTVTPVTSNICSGKSVTLTASGATTYTWTPAIGLNTTTGSVVIASPLVNTSYTVIGGAGTCTSSAVSVVNITPSPNIIITPSPSSVCVGSSSTLTATGATTYTWSTAAISSSIVVSPPSSTSYTVIGTGPTGCTNTATGLLTVVPMPIPNANSNSAVCLGATLNLLGGGGTTYSWVGPNSFASALQNPTIPGVTAAAAGLYTLTASAAGCSASVTTNVVITPPPVPVANSNSPICEGNTLNLFGSGGTLYGWTGPGYTGPNQNPVITNVTMAASGVYTLLIGVGSCTATTTTTVVINPKPVFNFSGANVLCNGQANGTSTVNVTVGTGPFNYVWNTIPVQNTSNATGLASGTYSCTVTDANGCINVASTQITQPTAFSVTINSATLSACAASPINITANGSGGTGPYVYNWVSGPSSSLYSVNEVVAGNYIYTVNATDAFNCPSSDIINLTFFPQPTITATSATVCVGETANITASGATTYIWQPGNITGSTYPYNGNSSINVSVIGTANGCSNSTNANITVNPLPTANISTGATKGCVPTCVTFTGAGSANVTSYGWTINGAGITASGQNGSYCFDKAASYSLGLNVMDANGCVGVASPMTVDIYPQPVADFNHSPIKPIINIDQDVTFTDASWGTPIISWNWYFMNTAQYTSVLQNPTFAYTEAGTYVVALVVKSDKGCLDTLLREIVVGEDFGIYVPNAFTPNGDGWNDTFQPKGFGITKYELNIFDRWGEKVFSTTTFEQGWNGIKQKSKDINYAGCEEGTYSWLINCTSVFGKAHELKGHVTLIR